MYLFSVTKVSFRPSLPKWTSAAAFLLYLTVTHFMSITHPENRKGGKKRGERSMLYLALNLNEMFLKTDDIA